jgi:hypothetical protein
MRKLLLAVAFVAGLAAPSGTALASEANGNHATFAWRVGADTAKAPDGSTITMQGQGTLQAGPDGTATGGGTFTPSNGPSGTWTATGVQEFVSYGPAPSGFPVPGAVGGEAKLMVSLSNGETGVLTIVCLLGSPPAGKDEGITLVLGAAVSDEYTKQDGGNTIFIAS